MKKHLDITVTGRVQGVGFRYNARSQAQSLNLCGFVKNLPDGSVYIEAEGEEKDLNEYLIWCRQGPPHAHVTNLTCTENELKGFSSFIIK